MRVSELMSPAPLKVRHDTTLVECARRMNRYSTPHLCVVDDDGALTGVLTDYAVFGAVRPEGSTYVSDDPDDPIPRADSRALPHLEARPEWDIVPVLQRMVRDIRDCVVVTDERRMPVGMLTEARIVRVAQGLIPDDLLALRRPQALVTVAGRDSPADAWKAMKRNAIRHLLVVDGRRLRGVVTLRDLARARLTTVEDKRLDELFRWRVTCCLSEGAPLVDVARMMVAHDIGCVPLVDYASRPVGILTRNDMVALTALVFRGLTPRHCGWDAAHCPTPLREAS